MKYLVSPLQLGKLIQENDPHKRFLMVEDLMHLYYIQHTTDDMNLNDHIKINELIRKEVNKKRWHK